MYYYIDCALIRWVSYQTYFIRVTPIQYVQTIINAQQIIIISMSDYQQPRVNLILLIMNILALTNFIYPCRVEFLFIIVLLIIYPLPYSIKHKMRVVTVLSLIASFMVNSIVCQLCCVVALGLAVSTAYELDLTEGPALINTTLGLAQIISFWSHSYLQKNTINRDITLMIFTLPNLFLCVQCEQSPAQKTLYLFYPLFDTQWLYSVGYVLGIYTTNLIGVDKCYKFFLIAFILLLEGQFAQDIRLLGGILAFLRGMLVYTQQKHQLQKYFIILCLLVKIIYPQILLGVMLLGYLLIGVVLLQQSRQMRQRQYLGKDQSVGTQQFIGYGVNSVNQYQLQQMRLIQRANNS